MENFFSGRAQPLATRPAPHTHPLTLSINFLRINTVTVWLTDLKVFTLWIQFFFLTSVRLKCTVVSSPCLFGRYGPYKLMFISQCVLFFFFFFFLSWISDRTQALLYTYTFDIFMCAHVYARGRYLVNFSCFKCKLFAGVDQSMATRASHRKSPGHDGLENRISRTEISLLYTRTITENWSRWILWPKNKHRTPKCHYTVEAVTPIPHTFYTY